MKKLVLLLLLSVGYINLVYAKNISSALNQQALAAAQSVMPSVVLISIEEGFSEGMPSSGSGGAGFFISSDGYILTNAHVVGADSAGLPPDSRITVQLYNGKTYIAKLIGFDRDLQPDVGVIKINLKNTPKATLSTGWPNYGDWLLAIGHPAGYGNWLTTAGQYIQHFESGFDFGSTFTNYEADIPIYSGNSGGPMVNLNGEVVGLINMSVSAEDIPQVGIIKPSPGAIIWDWQSFRSLKQYEDNAVGIAIADAMRSAASIIQKQGNVE